MRSDLSADVSFVVKGAPIPQGSKTANRYGGFREANKNLPGWREQVQLAGRVAMKGREPFDGPLAVTAVFMMPRPKSQKGRWCAVKPDLDKLLRGLGDGLSGIVVRDDARIVSWTARKEYGDPGVFVSVYRMEG